ncbi:MAG: hypothetical protein CSA65_00995 [Proteobacteria bacterium]|nr:MAG: hypothetical protein CSA65_00995 [Pseudomonadota bacterium]
MHKLLLGMTALVLGVLMGACESDLDRDDHKLATTYAGGGSKGGGRSYDTDRALARKLGKYIKCINTVANRVLGARSRYLSWVNEKKGPTCKERRIYDVFHTLYTVKACTRDLLLANSKKPSLPALRKAAVGFTLAVSKLKPLLDTAYLYYKKRRYKNDGCAQGKQLHPKLMAAWTETERYSREMRRLVDKHNNALKTRRMRRVVAKFGKTHPRYFLLKVIEVANSSLRVFRVQLREKKLDLKQLRSAMASFAAVIKEMMAGKPSDPGMTGYVRYQLRAEELLKAFEETVTQRASKKRFSRREKFWLRSRKTAHLVKGSYARVSKAYDRLVYAFNRVRIYR